MNFEYTKQDYVLFFGRLSEEKGVKIFADACRALPNIKFKAAGGGPMEECVKNIPNVDFVGFKTGDELHKLIAEAKFSVYPSVWYENCPLSILESESFGTPVICTDLGGMPELVEDNITGRVISEISSAALAAAIDDLYNDDELCRKMSDNCVKKRGGMITLDIYGKMIEEIYTEVLNDK